MKIYKFFLLFILTGSVLNWAVPVSAQVLVDVVPGDIVLNEYIVQIKPGFEPGEVAAAHGLAPKFLYKAALNGFAGHVPPGLLRLLQNDPRVESIVPDRVVAAIGKTSEKGRPQPPPSVPQEVPAGVARIGAAPSNLEFTGTDIGVAVVDTGLDFKHADLPIGNSSYSSVSRTAQDDNGHGTHVGGIIAALDNTQDVVGVAPGATLYAVKVLNRRGTGTESGVIDGINWISENADTVNPPIRVVNMSLGRAGIINDNPAYRTAIQNLYNKNITIVVAAGNEPGAEVKNMVPACYPEVIAVASTTATADTYDDGYLIPRDTASVFTTDGADVTISAPGEDTEYVSGDYIYLVGILSTKLGGGTTRMAGTSMAAPHVAGVTALLYEKAKGSLLPETARLAITQGASDIDTSPLDSPFTYYYSFDESREGVLSASGALQNLP